MGFVFTGIDPTYKVPRFLGKIVWSAGAISAASIPLLVLYIGMKTSAGSMTADVDVVPVNSEDDANGYAGPRSQLAWMARAGIKAAPTAQHFIAAVAEPTGTAATATLTLAGTWTTAGNYTLRYAGNTFSVPIAATDTIDTVGADIVSRVNGWANGPITAAYASGVVTFTCANLGAQGKDWIVQFDTSLLPAGMTGTLVGSASLGKYRVRLGASSSGTGVENATNIITKLQTTRYARIAVAQNDATNLGTLWKPQLQALEGVTQLMLEHVVVATSGTQSTATTLASSTLNYQRIQVLWRRNADIHPSVIAAVKAAIRASTENTTPVPDYDGLVLPGIPPALDPADDLLDSEQNAALQSGVTPCTTNGTNTVVVRSITSYCLTATGAPDTRTIDIGDAVMTDYAMLDRQLFYQTVFRPANPLVGPDPKSTEFEPPPGVAYPRLWNAELSTALGQWFRNGWIEDPSANPPVSQYNTTARAIESLLPIVVRRIQHQIRQVVRQTAP